MIHKSVIPFIQHVLDPTYIEDKIQIMSYEVSEMVCLHNANFVIIISSGVIE